MAIELEQGVLTELVDGGRRIQIEWIGEGISGDYDPEDPDDVPLLRFNVEQMLDGEWEQIEGSSYCSQIDARSDAKVIEAFARIVMDRTRGENTLRRICERLSSTTTSDVMRRPYMTPTV